jgi:hypothetical protein
LLKKASIGKLEGYVLIPNVAGKEIIHNYLYDFIKHEILEEYDTAVELERSEEMKSSHLHSNIIFLSRVIDSYAAINEIERCIELYLQTSDFHYPKAMELIEMIKEPTNELVSGVNEIYKECFEECGKAITIESDRPAYHLLRGYVLNAMDNPGERMKEIDLARKLGKDHGIFEFEKIQIDEAFRNLMIEP